MILILLILLLFLWLESTLTTIPLFLIAVSIMLIFYKQIWILGLGFFGGLILDITVLRPLGSTSIFLIVWLFLILLYERKYEINSYPFVLAMSFTGSIAFLLIFNYPNAALQAIMNSIIAVILFLVLKLLKTNLTI